MHEVLVNHLGGLSLPRKSVVRLTDRPDMTLDVYSGRKTTIQNNISPDSSCLKCLDSCSISGVHIFCEILSFYSYIWCTWPFLISHVQKKIFLVCRTYEYMKRCWVHLFIYSYVRHTRNIILSAIIHNDINNAPNWCRLLALYIQYLHLEAELLECLQQIL